ncbi:MAG: fimbrillin family protein [Bacteroides sp.]|nr:fimbrillin family protein [Bacteroides sp.]
MKDWNNIRIWMLTAAALCFASCTQSDGGELGNETLSPLAISILQVADGNGASTRATTALPTTGITVGFFQQASAGAATYEAINNREGKYVSSLWRATPDILLNDQEATLAVYAPTPRPKVQPVC